MHPATVGPFQILRELGRGGMGEVHLARDTRLDRQVAIKALPAHLTSDPDRLARFQREAKALASLNHPGIGAIYGLEEAGGHRYLILEYVEGETLAGRLERGAIPIEEALPLAGQMAAALEAAHEKGIVHRDLKPGNVMVTPDGVVKVLDFGLARTEEAPPTAGAAPTPADSPTITAPPPRPPHSPIIPGAIMGTAGYMSPEQARGRAVDKRSDIFSFGCVLFEMLTGVRPFAGETVADAIGATLHKEPDPALLPPHTPGRIRELLASCLAKDRKDRLRDIGDARLAIAHAGAEWGGPAEAYPRPSPRRWIPWAFAACAGALACATTWFVARPKEPAPPPVVRSCIPVTPGVLIEDGSGPVALSPDGRTIAFVGGASGEVARIWVRSLDSLSAQPLLGTEDATYPFWSPDGKNLGFFSHRKLRRIPAAGGGVTPVAESEDGRGGTWSIDNVIVFAPSAYGPLARVAATGGTATPITTLDQPKRTHRFPYFLPDGKTLLFTSGNTTARQEKTGAPEIVLLNLASGQTTPLVKAASQGLYTAPGHLFFVRDGSLVVQAIDVPKARMVGDPVVLAQDVSDEPTRFIATFSVSMGGTFVYRPSRLLARLEWFDLEGRSLGTVGEPADFAAIDLAPGGERAAVTIRREDGRYDIWACDTLRGTRVKLVEDVENNGVNWSSVGSRVAYLDLSGRCRVREADGSMKDTDLTQGFVTDWSRDAKLLTFTRQDPETQLDIYFIDASGGDPRVFLRTPARESLAMFSPGDNWLAYQSAPLDRQELFVAPITDGSAGRQVTSTGVASSCVGSTMARWFTPAGG